MLLRVILAGVCAAVVYVQKHWAGQLVFGKHLAIFDSLTPDPVGSFLASWVSTTWINTIIFGSLLCNWTAGQPTNQQLTYTHPVPLFIRDPDVAVVVWP